MEYELNKLSWKGKSDPDSSCEGSSPMHDEGHQISIPTPNITFGFTDKVEHPMPDDAAERAAAGMLRHTRARARRRRTAKKHKFILYEHYNTLMREAQRRRYAGELALLCGYDAVGSWAVMRDGHLYIPRSKRDTDRRIPFRHETRRRHCPPRPTMGKLHIQR